MKEKWFAGILVALCTAFMCAFTYLYVETARNNIQEVRELNRRSVASVSAAFAIGYQTKTRNLETLGKYVLDQLDQAKTLDDTVTILDRYHAVMKFEKEGTLRIKP